MRIALSLFFRSSLCPALECLCSSVSLCAPLLAFSEVLECVTWCLSFTGRALHCCYVKYPSCSAHSFHMGFRLCRHILPQQAHLERLPLLQHIRTTVLCLRFRLRSLCWSVFAPLAPSLLLSLVPSCYSSSSSVIYISLLASSLVSFGFSLLKLAV